MPASDSLTCTDGEVSHDKSDHRPPGTAKDSTLSGQQLKSCGLHSSPRCAMPHCPPAHPCPAEAICDVGGGATFENALENAYHHQRRQHASADPPTRTMRHASASKAEGALRAAAARATPDARAVGGATCSSVVRSLCALYPLLSPLTECWRAHACGGAHSDTFTLGTVIFAPPMLLLA